MVGTSQAYDSSPRHKKLVDLLKTNSKAIVDEWIVETSRMPYAKVGQMPFSLRHKTESLRSFFDAFLRRLEDSDRTGTYEAAMRMARLAHLSGLEHELIIQGHFVLRNILWRIIDHSLPEELRPPAKLEVDEVICSCVEESVRAHDELMQIQVWLMKGASSLPTQQATLDQALTRFCSSAMDYFSTDFVSLFRFEPETNELVCEVCCAKGVAMSKGTRVLLDGFPLAKSAVTALQPQMSPIAGGDEGARSRAIGNLTFARLMVVPAARMGLVRGVLMIGDTAKRREFYPEEVRISDELAGMIGLILDNSQRYRQLNLRSRAQKALIETGASLQQEIESEEMYRIIAERLVELIPCNELMFYMFDWERQVGNPVYATGPYAAEIMEDRDFPAGVGIVGAVAKARRAEIVMNSETDTRGAQIPGTPASHCRMLAVPILGRKEVLGVIELLKYPPDNFTQEDLEVATMFANQAAVAIENSKLLRQVTETKNLSELHVDLLTHDIANYATPVAAYFAELRDREDLALDVKDVVTRTVKQMEYMIGLVDMARTLAKVRGARGAALRKVDMRQFYERAVADVGKRVSGEEVQFKADLPDGPIEVMADDLLYDFFSNLFLAAMMSERQGPVKFTVTARPKKEYGKDFWHLMVAWPGKHVTDKLRINDLGMAKERKGDLAGGLGVGLVALKSLAERYGGRAWISDIVPGDKTKGWMFNATFPRV